MYKLELCFSSIYKKIAKYEVNYSSCKQVANTKLMNINTALVSPGIHLGDALSPTRAGPSHSAARDQERKIPREIYVHTHIYIEIAVTGISSPLFT